MKKNKIQPQNWFRRIGIAAVSTLLISISGIAHGQCTQCDVDYRNCRFSDCGSRCQGGGCHGLAGQRGLAGGGVGALAGAKQNVALLAHRETPPGNMGLHFPYNATQMYYYRRPYNDYHVPTHLGESRDGNAQSTVGKGLGYSHQIFEQVHDSTEQYYNSQHGTELDRDGLLEFVDWRDHREQRQIWESTPRYHSEYRDDSYPAMNEEVMNRNSKENSDYEELSRSAAGSGLKNNLKPTLNRAVDRTRNRAGSTKEEFQETSFQRRVSSLPSKSSLYKRK